jgi:hypothetical protein
MSDALPTDPERPHTRVGTRIETRATARRKRRLGLGLGTFATIGLLFGSITNEAGADDVVVAQSVDGAATSTTPTDLSTTSPNVPSSTTPGSVPSDATSTTQPSTSTTQPSIVPKTWNVLVGGDSLLTRKPTVNPFLRQRPLLGDADLAIINVETALGSATDKQSKTFTFRSPVKFAEFMGEAGVDVGSLANNHALDFGDQGLLDSIDILRDAGVTPIGAGVNLKAALEPSTHTIKGTKVAVFGASQVIPAPGWVATGNSIGIASAGKHRIDKATTRLLDAVTTARATHDVVIVYMHWGIERSVCPSPIQIELGKLLRDAGATAVVGAHPHVLQPIVRDPTGVVAYSVGNFIWDPRSGITGDSGLLELRFDGATLAGVNFHPHRLDGQGWAVPVKSASDRTRILNQVQRKCAGANGTGSLTSAP